MQEFTAKSEEVNGARRHFIGHLQLNKVKYLIGRTDLVESVDRDELATELAKRSVRAGIVTDILIEVNIGCEESKSGYPLEEAFSAYERLSRTEGLRVKGFMAMLPLRAMRSISAALSIRCAPSTIARGRTIRTSSIFRWA